MFRACISRHLDCNLTIGTFPPKVGSCREAVHRRQANREQAAKEVNKEQMGKVTDKVIRGESVRDATRGGDGTGDDVMKREHNGEKGSEESDAERRSGGWRRGGGGGGGGRGVEEDEGGRSTNSSMASRWRAAGGEVVVGGGLRATDGVRETHIGGREGEGHPGGGEGGAVREGGGGGGPAGGVMLAAPAPATRARSYDVLTDNAHYQVVLDNFRPNIIKVLENSFPNLILKYLAELEIELGF